MHLLLVMKMRRAEVTQNSVACKQENCLNFGLKAGRIMLRAMSFSILVLVNCLLLLAVQAEESPASAKLEVCLMSMIFLAPRLALQLGFCSSYTRVISFARPRCPDVKFGPFWHIISCRKH